jgi:alcohol dehydrogenase class IV
VLRFNCQTAPAAYVEIAPFAFPELGRLEGQERAAAFCDALQDLSRKCSLPQRLRDAKVPEDVLPTLARDAMNQTRLLPNNPRLVTEADALDIYRRAW